MMHPHFPVQPSTIDGVWTQPLREIPTAGGPVLHMLRSDHPLFSGFGEVYFSEVEPGAIKAWKRHTRQTQLFAVPVGCMSITVYDARSNSSSKGTVATFTLGRPGHYQLLCIPHGLWYGFTAISNTPAIMANCADLPHAPDESERLPYPHSDIPFTW